MNEVCFRMLLRALSEKNDLDLYEWHQTSLVSPIELATVLKEGMEKGLLAFNQDGCNVALTPYGQEWLKVNGTKMFGEEGEKSWKEMPQEMTWQNDDMFEEIYISDDLKKLLNNM